MRQLAALAATAILLPFAAILPVLATPVADSVAVRLPYHQDVEVEVVGTRLKLQLTEVNDSRCPARVTCVWAGVAGVGVRVSELAPASAVPVEIGLRIPGDPQTAFGVVFALDDLQPRPATDGSVSLSAYVADVRIWRPMPN